MLKQYLETGKIVTTPGLKGEVKVYPWRDDAEELLDSDVLYLNKGKPIAIVEAKDNNHSISHGLQQAMTYAQMLDVPFATNPRMMLKL